MSATGRFSAPGMCASANDAGGSTSTMRSDGSRRRRRISSREISSGGDSVRASDGSTERVLGGGRTIGKPARHVILRSLRYDPPMPIHPLAGKPVPPEQLIDVVA